MPTSSYGSLLVPVLLSKIPEHVRLLIGREIKDDQWELGRLLNLLRYEVENRERCLGIKAALPAKFEPGFKSVNSPANKQTQPTAAALFTESKQYGNAPNCTYCFED